MFLGIYLTSLKSTNCYLAGRLAEILPEGFQSSGLILEKWLLIQTSLQFRCGLERVDWLDSFSESLQDWFVPLIPFFPLFQYFCQLSENSAKFGSLIVDGASFSYDSVFCITSTVPTSSISNLLYFV